MRGTWTKTATLPGGDIKATLFGEWERNKGQRLPFSRSAVAVAALPGLRHADRLPALGHRAARRISAIDFGAGLSQREVDYLVENEWAETAEDILWRRSKLGLHVGDEGRAALEAYLAQSSGNTAGGGSGMR